MAIVWYKGVQVVEPTTGAGGEALTNSLKTLADRTYLTDTAESPTTSHDDAAGYENGSIWWESDSSFLYFCRDNTNGAAEWLRIAMAGSGDFLENVVEDLTPQLGGALDMNGNNIEGVTPTEMGYVSGVTSSIQTQLNAKLENVVEDSSPQLGGDLDMNAKNIWTGTNNISPSEMDYLNGTQLTLVDGSRGFTGVVAGITPTATNHLTTKQYVDSTIQGIDWQESVVFAQAAPPGSPDTGDRYRITTGTGAWTGYDDYITTYSGTGWTMTAPNDGMAVWDESSDYHSVYNGAAWVRFGSTMSHTNLNDLDTNDDHLRYLSGYWDHVDLAVAGGATTSKIYTSGTNHPIVVEPNGTGGFALSSTGNTRGTYSVDLQRNRLSAYQVAAGNYSFVMGQNNYAKENYSVVFGLGNLVNGDTSTFTAYLSTIAGGSSNTIGGSLSALGDSNNCFIGSGASNTIENITHAGAASEACFIGAGLTNQILGYAPQSAIVGGNTNKIYGAPTGGTICSIIGAGKDNRVGSDSVGTDSASYAGILAGSLNEVHSDRSIVGAGYTNAVRNGGRFGGILAGSYNIVGGGMPGEIGPGSGNGAHNCAVIAGGSRNEINNDSNSATYSFIGAGRFNRIGAAGGATACRYSFIGAGGYNNADSANTITDSYCFIGAGFHNKVNDGYGFIGAGYSNTVDGTGGAIINGVGNTIHAAADWNIIGAGLDNQIFSDRCFIGSGDSSTINTASNESVICGGGQNYISTSDNAFIGGGLENEVRTGSYESVVAGGKYNRILGNAYHSGIGAGSSNEIQEAISYIGGGQFNVIDSNLAAEYSVIGGGSRNEIGHPTASSSHSQFCVIGGGQSNQIQNTTDTSGTASWCAILSGYNHTIEGYAQSSVIGGGHQNIIQNTGTQVFGNTIAGGRYGRIGSDTVQSNFCYLNFIGGGQSNAIGNTHSCVIGGGYQNYIYNGGTSAARAVLGGGINNRIGTDAGTASTYASVLVGGQQNVIGTGAYAFLGTGRYNEVHSAYSSVVGGEDNTIEGTAANHSFIGGGENNVINSDTAQMYYCTISGGYNNLICNDADSDSAWQNTISGGDLNRILGHSVASNIGGGFNNTIDADTNGAPQSCIAGGRLNTIGEGGLWAARSFIGGGYFNKVGHSYSVICGGSENQTFNSGYTFIGGGQNNKIDGGDAATVNVTHAAIVGGQNNQIGYADTAVSGSGAYACFIGAGANNRIACDTSSDNSHHSIICGGVANEIRGNATRTFIGGGDENFIGGGGQENEFAAIVCGRDNRVGAAGGVTGGSPFCTVVGGFANLVYNDVTSDSTQRYNAIINGTQNELHGSYSSIIGGGEENKIYGDTSTYWGVVCGGGWNQIGAQGSGGSPYAFIGGGLGNQIYNSGTNDSGSVYNVIAGGHTNSIISGNQNCIGGGNTNVIGHANPTHSSCVIAGGYGNKISNDSGNMNSCNILGGTSNQIGSDTLGLAGGDYCTISGGYNCRIYNTDDTNKVSYSHVGGGKSCWITGIGTHRTIAGGWENRIYNANKTGQGSTISGGYQNIIQDSLQCFIGGGANNEILAPPGGTAIASYGVIGGGRNNNIGSLSSSSGTYTEHCVIGGGRNNDIYNTLAATASDDNEYCTISGGYNNLIQGNTIFATVCGGGNNNIYGTTSGWGLGGHGSTIVGGNYNDIGAAATTGHYSWCFIGGGLGNDIIPNAASDDARYQFHGGGTANVSTGPNYASVMVGGRDNFMDQNDGSIIYACGMVGGFNNRIGSDSQAAYVRYAFLGGGYGNKLATYGGVIGGGDSNLMEAGMDSANHDCRYSVIGGGVGNVIRHNGDDALANVIVGGQSNRIGEDGTPTNAICQRGFIGGGYLNLVIEEFGTIPGGFQGKAERYGEMVHSAGQLSLRGDAQTMVLVLRRNINRNVGSHINLFTDGGSKTLFMNDGDLFSYHILLSARTVTTGVCAAWELTGAVKCDAGTAVLLPNNASRGSTGKVVLGKDAGATSFDAQVSVSTNDFRVMAHNNGVNENCKFVARVQICKVHDPL